MILASDTNAEAIAIAKENAELNEVADRIDFQVGSVNEQTSSADLVCANLTAPVIVELLPTLIGATCGRLVPSRDPDALASSLAALALDAPLRQTLGHEARARVEQHFTLDRMVREYRNLYYTAARH